jgi:DNA-directed RNA polymerase subunit RPC12/RpoP
VKKPAVMYRCVVCGRPITATPGDAVHMITGGPHCSECLGRKSAASMAAPAKVPSTGRADAARARWAAMTPEQKAERVRKLKAGRKAQAAAAGGGS